eukprot:838526-Amphidinium_carterae.1
MLPDAMREAGLFHFVPTRSLLQVYLMNHPELRGAQDCIFGPGAPIEVPAGAAALLAATTVAPKVVPDGIHWSPFRACKHRESVVLTGGGVDWRGCAVVHGHIGVMLKSKKFKRPSKMICKFMWGTRSVVLDAKSTFCWMRWTCPENYSNHPDATQNEDAVALFPHCQVRFLQGQEVLLYCKAADLVKAKTNPDKGKGMLQMILSAEILRRASCERKSASRSCVRKGVGSTACDKSSVKQNWLGISGMQKAALLLQKIFLV